MVEGTYDKIKLSSIVDTLIIPTNGFSIFQDADKLKYLRSIAQKRGIIVLTDSDRAGFLIRNYIKQGMDPSQVKHAYIPDVPGKEKRKRQPGREGKLGVEGIETDILYAALQNAGATPLNGDELKPSGRNIPSRQVTKLDFYKDGLTGGSQSAQKRRALAAKLSLPARLSANMLLETINSLLTYEEYRNLVDSL